MKPRLLAMILAAAAAAALFGYQQWRAAALDVTAERPSRGPLSAYVEERATTRLSGLHHVTMPQAALVRPQPLEIGAAVRAGQLLAQLDSRPLELAEAEALALVEEQSAILDKSRDNSLENRAQQQAESLVDSIRATVEAATERVQAGQERAEFAKRIRDRLRGIANAASKNELEQAELQAVEAVSSAKQDELVVSASRAVQSAVELLPRMVGDFIQRKKLDDEVTTARKLAAEARLQQTQFDQQRASLKSPVDGVVLEAPVDTPRHLGFGETVFLVGRLDDLEIEADILSEDAVRIAAGDPCVVFGPALAASPEGSVPATVQRVSPQAFKKISSLGVEQQRVRVVIHLDPPQREAVRRAGLGVGYQVDVRIVTDSRRDALQIPRSALFRDARERWQVFVIEGGRARQRTVTLGIHGKTHAEVLSGLDEQDLVIVEPDARIEEGGRVRPRGY